MYHCAELSQHHYQTKQGMTVTRTCLHHPYENAIEALINDLDACKGALFASSFEYPGRYTRWDIGFKNPNLELTTRGYHFSLCALNQRGQLLLLFITPFLQNTPALITTSQTVDALQGYIQPSTTHFSEEERSKQPSVFHIIRALISLFYSSEDPFLGLYGAFGYDLTFQFENIALNQQRAASVRDMVLYLPDEMMIVDHQKRTAHIYQYDFAFNQQSTVSYPRDGRKDPYQPANQVVQSCDHAPGDYVNVVQKAKDYFKRGDLFEVVTSQLFSESLNCAPSVVFRRLRARNPSPYGFLINLGKQEYLVGASPEMYVKVTGNRVETSPISGTIARGNDAIGDAEQIFKLLSSKKDESELTMCTDVDRNDKSRICEPGSVRVIGRRLIEMYSRLIHTVDHVEGSLRSEYDAIDAFLTHMWVVTVTGAPKNWAMQFIENNERSPRHWYGGAVGWINFDGNMNTGLTLRTIRIAKGIAEVRVGATLLYDSIPEEEEKETQLKGLALITAIRQPLSSPLAPQTAYQRPTMQPKKILLVDHQDSFVHTLANYLRQTGATVITLRAGFNEAQLDQLQPDLVVLSPGPGRPCDFALSHTLKMTLARKLPIFGVCLGLQGIVEYFGGKLGTLDYPMHGKPVKIHPRNSLLFKGLPDTFTVGLYHSLYALADNMPTDLIVSAYSEQGIIMAVEHKSLPIWAVQFHPESIMSLGNNIGIHIIFNVIAGLSKIS